MPGIGDDLSTRSGSYTLLKKKGDGGQSEVWHAQDQDGNDRAIKIALANANKRIEAEILALREIVEIPALARHVVRIRDHGVVEVEGGSRRFIVLDYFEHSLAELLRKAELLERARLACSACASLVAVQKALPRLVHRDIKPANFLVKGAFVVISDYGAVKDLDSHTTSEGMQTLAYAPPEQRADPSRGVSPGWDTYAMAATVFCVLVGEPPHLEGEGNLLAKDIERIRLEFQVAIEERRGEGARLGSAVESLVGALRGILRAKPQERVGLEVLAQACALVSRELERPMPLEEIPSMPRRNLDDTARGGEERGRGEGARKGVSAGREPPRPVLDRTVRGGASVGVAPVVEPARVVGTERAGMGVKVVVGVGAAFGGMGVLGVLGWIASQEVQKERVPVKPAWGQDCAVKGMLPCRTVTEKGVSFDMVQVPATSAAGFEMGSPESEEGRVADETLHTVVLSEPFWMAKVEVTQGLWEAVMGENPSATRQKFWGGMEKGACSDYGVGGELPVYCVDWVDTVRFANRLSELHGLTPAYSVSGETVSRNAGASGYRLPTESEWEYTARAGGRGLYAGAASQEEVCRHANVANATTKARYSLISDVSSCDDGYEVLAPVGKLKPNGWGLHDMTGNVREWCWDWYGDYPSGLVPDPGGAQDGSIRVSRGGSWYQGLADARVADRNGGAPSLRSFNLGLRLARSSVP